MLTPRARPMDDLLINATTRASLDGEGGHWVECGSVPLKGKAEDVALHARAALDGAR